MIATVSTLHPGFSAPQGTQLPKITLPINQPVRLKQYLSPKAFWDKIVRPHPEEYLGPGLPETFLQDTADHGRTPRQQMLKSLDQLAQFLRKMDCPHLPAFQFTVGNRVFECEAAGQGCFGTVYRLTTQSQNNRPESYAFKVYNHATYYDIFNENHDGPVGEILNGVLLNNQASDVPTFYMGNPHPGKQWMLSQWVSDETPVKPGPKYADLIARHEMFIHDDKAANRSKNGYRVDLGGIGKMSTLGYWLHVGQFYAVKCFNKISGFVSRILDWCFFKWHHKTVDTCRTLSEEIHSTPADKRPELLKTLEPHFRKMAARYHQNLKHVQLLPPQSSCLNFVNHMA